MSVTDLIGTNANREDLTLKKLEMCGTVVVTRTVLTKETVIVHQIHGVPIIEITVHKMIRDPIIEVTAPEVVGAPLINKVVQTIDGDKVPIHGDVETKKIGIVR